MGSSRNRTPGVTISDDELEEGLGGRPKATQLSLTHLYFPWAYELVTHPKVLDAVEDLLGLQTGDAHIIRNAGGVVTDDAIRCLIISHHLLDTNEVILIHHTRCGMLAFTDDLLKAGLEGDAAAEKLLGQATGRAFTSCKKCAATPAQFHAFRGPIEPLGRIAGPAAHLRE